MIRSARTVQIHYELLNAGASAYFAVAAMWDLTSQRLRFHNSELYGDTEGSAVLINEDTGALDITGISHAIGHYARWAESGAARIEPTSSDPLVQVSAFDHCGRVALVPINNAASPKPAAVRLAGRRITGALTGEQSTPSGYWERLAEFAPSTATARAIALPRTGLTSIGGRMWSTA